MFMNTSYIWEYTGYQPALGITDLPTSSAFCPQVWFPMCWDYLPLNALLQARWQMVLQHESWCVACAGDVAGIPGHERSTVHGLHNDGPDDVAAGLDDVGPVLGEAGADAEDVLRRRPPADVPAHEDEGDSEDEGEGH